MTAAGFRSAFVILGKGGQAAFQNSNAERRDMELLQRKWRDVAAQGGHSGTRKRDYARRAEDHDEPAILAVAE